MATLTLTMNPSLEIATSVERVVDTDKLRCEPEQSHPGGGGINVARVINNMGGNSIAAFPFGGFTGKRLCMLLEQERVTIQGVEVESETRQCFSVHERSTTHDFRFVLPGHPLPAQGMQACLDGITTLKTPPRYLVASGSLPPGVPDDFYATLGKRAANMGSLYVLDTSGAPLAHALASGGIYLIKPSLAELEELTDRPLKTEVARLHAAQAIIRKGQSKLVALSLGDQGALLISDHGCWRAASLPVQPVSTVGAGDSFVGGMIWALSRSMAIEQAFRYAIACATGTILNAHGQMCQQDEVSSLFQRVEITPI